jgi:hypothetical protein
VHVVGFGLALMIIGAIAVLCGLAAERRRRHAPLLAPPALMPAWAAAATIPCEETRVKKHEHEEETTGRAPPREATSPWSRTDVDDAQLDPSGQGLALAPGRHTIIVVCGDCAKARTIQKQLAERASLSSIVALPDDEPPITSAVFQPVDLEPLRHAHGGRTTPPSTQAPRHAADPWDFAHHDRRRR